MTEAILLLRLEHHQADDLLKLLEEQLARDAPLDLELVTSIVDYFSDYPDQCHHPVEDLVYRKLLARNPEGAAKVGELLQDHEKISQVTKRLAEALGASAGNGDTRMAGLRKVVREFVDHYRAHMMAEEKDFFPLALNTLSEDDWGEVEFDLFDRRDPLFDREAEGRFRSLREKIDKLARRSYRRGAFIREAKQLRQLTSIQAFNDMMKEAGVNYRIVEHPEGAYGLEHHGRPIIDIPRCSPTRAAWCAYFYLEAAAGHT